MIRIAHGKFKGRQLKIKYQQKPRPTLSICRESLFNIIGENIKGSVFLDLFAGSGAVGIEAYSRGAAEIFFVEQDTLLCKSLRDNIRALAMQQAVVLQGHFRLQLLKLKKNKHKFDFIFIDPPYGFSYPQEPILQILKHQILKPKGILIVEREQKDVYYPEDFLVRNNLQKIDERHYGVSVLEWFLY